MKTSVLIIAHNEEKYIEKCIRSVIRQTKKPDEIVLIAHNCDDKTIDIARKFDGVDIKIFNGKEGVAEARLFGLDQVVGDYIFCIDGDSYAQDNWLEEMNNSLLKYDLVGSIVKFKGTIFGRIHNFVGRFNSLINKIPFNYIWGPSFAICSRDVHLVKEYLIESVKISDDLKLKRNPEDFIMALLMQKKSHKNLFVTNKTYVFQNQKEKNSIEAMRRSRENTRAARAILDYDIMNI